MDTDRRLSFIQALRDCAAFLEAHPDVEAPRYVVMNVFVHTKDGIIKQARAASWEKVYNDMWFYLRHTFGDDLTLDITTERSTVCERIVTGTRLVPASPEHEIEEVTWSCGESLLAETR